MLRQSSRSTSRSGFFERSPSSLSSSNSGDRKSTRLNSSHLVISYAVFCLKKKKKTKFVEMQNTSKCISYTHVFDKMVIIPEHLYLTRVVLSASCQQSLPLIFAISNSPISQ